MFFVEATALADDKQVCINAASQGQSLRDDHRLIEARDQFRVCAREVCPGILQHDCVAWLDGVEKALPTIVLSAKDGTGHEVFDVSVSMDGAPLATQLDGRALPVNPGVHAFRFSRGDGTSSTQTVLVKEGGKAQTVAASLGERAQPLASAAPQGSTSPPLDGHTGGFWNGTRVGAIVVGAGGLVALGVGGLLGLDAKSKDTTAAGEPGTARQTDSQSAVSEGNVASVVVGVGAALAVTGVVLWLVAPKARVLATAMQRGVVVGGRF